MANLIKIGSTVFKVGNTILTPNKYSPYNYVATITASGLKPYRSAVDTVNNKLYVANSSSTSLYVFDLTTFALITTVTTGTVSYSVTVDNAGNRLFVGGSNGLYIYDLTTYSLITTLSSGGRACVVL